MKCTALIQGTLQGFVEGKLNQGNDAMKQKMFMFFE